MRRNFFGVLSLVWLSVAPWAFCADDQAAPKDAEPATKAANAKVLQELPFSNMNDFVDASRGFIDTLPDGVIKGANGEVVWDLTQYKFLSAAQVPSTVNPSLWRQAVLNMNNGLFKVTDGIYQVRGFDLASMMIVEGNSGIILIDPMTATETAKAALELYRKHRLDRPIVAVIYTHSHADHYGGVKGVISEEDASSGKVQVIAPDGFLDHALSENVFAGTAMGRRALYHTGSILARGPRGQVDTGLGKSTANGSITLIAPQQANIIQQPLEVRTIDGLEVWFQLAPETEAPAEMLIWFPQLRALCAAEDMNHLNHNLLTPRGAQVRNARNWWKVINQALDQYTAGTDVMFFAHTWPVWGKENIVNFMKKQRDLYKYVHDQSLHLMNQGYTMIEISEKLKLPQSLAQEWFNRDYYGTVIHNAKAVYQRYLGWYDSNPVNLHALPPEETAKKYLAYMGSAQAVIARARQEFEAGDYRWVAQIMNTVVFAEPDNREAKELEADALEQLGYQAESGVWRNSYLQAASELRNGLASMPANAGADMIKAMPMDLYFDYMGILLNGPKADGKYIVLNWEFTDGQKWVLTLENSVLTYVGPERQSSAAHATLQLARATLDEITLGKLTWQNAISLGLVEVQGDASKLFELLGLLEPFELGFNIMTP